MPLDKKDDSSYMDGVPVKISEKYKRRPVIRLPNSCQNPKPGPAFYQQYDFGLEKSVIGKMEEWKRARDQDTANREEQVKRWTAFQEEAQMKLAEKEETPLSEAESYKPCSTGGLPSNILTPITASSVAQTIPRTNLSSINYSDFEEDNNPFDNVELKAINDMEVLASVLSTSADSQAAVAVPNPINKNAMHRNGVVWNGWEGYGVGGYSSPQYYHSPPQYQNMVTPGYSVSNSYPHPAWPSGGEYYQTTSNTYAATTSNHYPQAFATPRIESNIQSQRNNSKSVPDLVVELEKELREKQLFDAESRKTKTPPPRPVTTKAKKIENNEWKPWPELDSPRNGEADAFFTLSPSHQSLARSIREMGFPLERIVRTIQKFEGDDKKVIEFLIQVQRLGDEKKFSGDLVESALHANSYNEQETLKHLQAASVLLDLGFPNEKVQQVLLECKNDRDLALEKLIS